LRVDRHQLFAIPVIRAAVWPPAAVRRHVNDRARQITRLPEVAAEQAAETEHGHVPRYERVEAAKRRPRSHGLDELHETACRREQSLPHEVVRTPLLVADRKLVDP